MEHLDSKSISTYADGKADPATLLAASDHMVDCEACRKAVETHVLSTRAWPKFDDLVAEDGVEHLSEEELEVAARDQDLLSPEAVAHLRGCEQCCQELRDASSYLASEKPRTARRKRSSAASPPRHPIRTVLGVAAMILIATMLFERYTAHHSNSFVAQLRDGTSILGLDGKGTLHGLPASEQEYYDVISNVLRDHRMPLEGAAMDVRSMQRLSRDSGPLPAYHVVSPIDELTDASPQLCWSPLPAATSYTVTISDEVMHVVGRSELTSETCWKSTANLVPGESYTWMVVAETPQGAVQTPVPPMPEARFAVLSPTKLVELTGDEERLPDSHLMLALLTSQLGLRTRAKAEIHALRLENPNSALAMDLENSMSTR